MDGEGSACGQLQRVLQCGYGEPRKMFRITPPPADKTQFFNILVYSSTVFDRLQVMI